MGTHGELILKLEDLKKFRDALMDKWSRAAANLAAGSIVNLPLHELTALLEEMAVARGRYEVIAAIIRAEGIPNATL